LETQRQKRLRLYEEQRQRQIAEAQLAKLGETLDSFIRLKRKKDHSPRYWSELEATLKRELSGKLGADRTIASITKTELQQLLDRKLADHPGAARTLYSALSPFFKWCVAREISPKPPLDGIDAPPLPQERDRILTEAELRSFWSATAQLDYLCPYFRLLLLTAQRRNEVSSIQWHELDLEKGEWLIPGEGAKNNKSHLVHLSPQALEILRAKPAFVGKGIASFGSAKKTLDKLMDVDPGNPWRIHDLRRTAASGMSELGILPHIIDKVLNHVPAKLQKIYQRNENLQERKRALEVWGAYVEALVSGRPAQGNVLQFAR
jgi:integrase